MMERDRNTELRVWKRRVGRCLSLLIVLVASFWGRGSVSAQHPSFFDTYRKTYFWLRHIDGRGIGDVQPYTSAGATRIFDAYGGAWMLLGQGFVSNNGRGGANTGLIRRFQIGDSNIVGGGMFYDFTESRERFGYHQLGLSLDWYHGLWGFRFNGYQPVGDRVNDFNTAFINVSDPTFQGNNILADGFFRTFREEAARGLDVELERSFCERDLESFIGYYNYEPDGGSDQAHGMKFGFRGFVTNRLIGSFTLAYDDLSRTNVFGGLTWYGGGSTGYRRSSFGGNITRPMERNEQVAVYNQFSDAAGQTIVLTNQGNLITVTHVNGDGTGPGLGTFEDPFDTIADANGSTDNIVYVHSGTSFTGVEAGYSGTDHRVLGEGGDNQHFVATDQLGNILLPEVNGIGLARPNINSPTSGLAFQMLGNFELSNFDITSSATAIEAQPGIGSVANINRVGITGGQIAIDSLGSGGLLNVTGVTITDPTLNAINLSGGDLILNFGGSDNGIDSFGASSIVQSATGSVLNVSSHAGVFTLGQDSTINATGGNGLQFDAANGSYTFDGQVELNGADAGIDILNGSAGVFSFANTNITSPTGTALNVSDSAATIQYVGNITQASNAVTLAFTNDTSNFSFVGGTISATSGTGLVFDNADGSYAFDSDVALNGAGINIANDSDGAFRFTNTDITDGPLNIGSGSSEVDFLADSSILLSAGTNAVSITDHEGRLQFDGSLSSFAGTGVLASNLSGTYNFDGALMLSGSEAIDIQGGSGVFNFGSGTNISNPSNAAVRINNNSGEFNFAGSIVDNADGIAVTNGTAATTLNVVGSSLDVGGDNNTGILFQAEGGTLSLENVSIDMIGASTIGIAIDNTSDSTAMNLSGTGNTVTGATTNTTSTDAGGGFNGTIEVNAGTDDLP